ncbi:MAG: ABC transporter permease [bacterium]
MSKAFFVQLRREFGALLLSPIAYVTFVCMALVNGFCFMQCAHMVAEGVRDFTVMQIFFYIFYFWIILIILTPALTMRLFSDEYKMGTIEPLLTAPIQEWDVVLAKFFAAVGIYLLMWAPTLFYLAVFQAVTKHQMPVVWGPVILAYGMVSLVGMFWISIGLFASSLTKNQIVAAMMSFTVIALLFFIGFLSYMLRDAALKDMINYIFTLEHMKQFSRGFFDTRPVVFYLSGTLLFLVLTHRVLMSRRLKG